MACRAQLGFAITLLTLASCGPASAPAETASSEHASVQADLPAGIQSAKADQEQESAPPHELGPVKVGMFAAEVTLLGWQFEKAVEDQEGEDVIVYVLHWPGGGDARLTMLQGKVADITTTSPKISTPSGAHVGDTLGALMAVYPKGEAVHGFEEGPYYSFATNENGEVFRFDVDEIGFECAPNGSNCRGRGDPSQYKSVSLSIR